MAMAAALDPVVFARQAGVEPDGWQAGLLRSDDRRILLNASRQSGKSTTAAIMAAHRAAFRPESLVLLVSTSLRQSGELFRTTASLYARSGQPAPVEESLLRLTLTNGSRIISLPGSEQTIRGYAGVDLIVIDEAARVEDPLFHAVVPMLATTNGRLIAMSTPFGKRGWWAAAWYGSGDWRREHVSAYDVPRISREWLEEQRREMPERWFSQEFLGEFADAKSAVFREADIEAMFSDDIEAWTF